MNGPARSIQRDADGNPYAAPQSDPISPQPSAAADVQTLRSQLLIREAAIRSIGSMYYLLATLAFVGMTVAALNGSPNLPVLALAGCVVTLTGAVIGWGLRRLDPSFRAVGALPALGLLPLFPLGTVVGMAILYFLLSPRSHPIFTAEYQQVMARAPDRHHAWSCLMTLAWLVFVVLAALLTVGIRSGWRVGGLMAPLGPPN